MTVGIYIHIPFCKQKCFYCDFPSYAGLEQLQKDYTAALCQEIAMQGMVQTGQKADTVFIGGGTPTLLATELLARIIQSVKKHFSLADDAEISMEANPGTVDSDKLSVLRELGVNRLSFGIQSFNDALLSRIGRIHTSLEAVEAVETAKKAGFTNINVDLMYGLPNQTLDDVKASLSKAVNLGTQHISVYGLKVEENTVFSKAEAAGSLALPDERLEEAMYDEINTFLPRQGFLRYEISNFAKANYKCRHNIKYWRYQPYIGLGAAAHSFYNKRRYANTADVQKYIQCLHNGQSALDFSEEPDTKTQMAEFVFLALRMTEGLAIKDFNTYFGRDFYYTYDHIVEHLAEEGLIIADEKGLRLTLRGMKFGNIVFRSFLPD